MSRTHSLLVTGLVLLAAVASFVFVSVIGSRSAASAATTGPIAGAGVLRLGNAYRYGTNYDRYRYVIVGPMDVDKAAGQPGISLVYKSGPDISDSSYTAQESIPTGVSLTEARANGWVLKDSNGAEIKEPNWPYYLGDVGSSGYQQAWARNVGDFLARHGADGVYIDNVVADVVGLTGGKYPARYPNQQAWENAMASFVAYVGPALKARGFYVLANTLKYIYGAPGADDGSMVADWWRRVGPHLSGLMSEYWQQNPNNVSQLRASGPAWYQNWDGWQRLVDVAQDIGRDFVGIQKGSRSSTGTMRYGRASFLLDWNGRGGAYVFSTSDSEDPWNTEWTVDIGSPAGEKYAVGRGWRRQYTGGTVVVNPSASASQSFSLGGTYLTPSGSSVTSVSLQPTSALILRSTNSTSVAAPSNTSSPSVDGLAQDGEVLTASNGAWSPVPTKFDYQWKRCDSAGTGCASVAGATASQYVVGSVDVGRTLRIEVTATTEGGSATAVSPPTAVVASAPAQPSSPSGTVSELAGGRSASSSSSESASLTPGRAVDGNGSTRWSSRYADGEWWQVDLGAARSVSAVAFNWETAYASSYEVRVSTDGVNFRTVSSVSLAQPGWKRTEFSPVSARYVRMHGVKRATRWGFSFWEAQVFGSTSSTEPTPDPAPAPEPEPTPQPESDPSPAPGPLAELAGGRSASSSSSESASLTPGRAVDGNGSTRWSSRYADGEWWQVDLGAARSVSAVAFNWETAYASSYEVRVSTDGVNFRTVSSVSLAQPGWKRTEFSPVSARYVRMHGVKRATRWGFSFWEAQVLGTG